MTHYDIMYCYLFTDNYFTSLAKEGVSFFIEHVKLTNSGVYKCIATNNETKASVTFNLTVDGK